MSLEAISVAVGEEEGSGEVVDGNLPTGMLTEPGSTRSWERVVAIVIYGEFKMRRGREYEDLSRSRGEKNESCQKEEKIRCGDVLPQICKPCPTHICRPVIPEEMKKDG
jgi:hypothetical protein